jgi:acyl-CoA hydrolase
MQKGPKEFAEVADCVEAILTRVGSNVVLGLPLGIGKPNVLANELYRRAREDRQLHLKIFTALSLRVPVWHSELERRFLQPFTQRLFGGYRELDFVLDLHRGVVPPNVEVIEFFLEPGSYLNVEHSQQHYLSANYTHVARELDDRGVNVLAQLVARRTQRGEVEYSLGSNPDVTVDLLARLEPERRGGRELVVVGEVHRQMPFTFGDAEVRADTFDFILDNPRLDYDLYSPPNLALNTTEYAIGLYATLLVKDGGTLQLGIGELGDAIVYCLQLRHQRNAEFREILDALRVPQRFAGGLADIGGMQPFVRGLYGCSEMFVDGFLDLYRCGILKRRVFPDLRVQRLLSGGVASERIDAGLLAALADSGLVGILSAQDFNLLQKVGVFRAECRYSAGEIRNAEGVCVAARLDDAAIRDELLAHCTGRQLTGGALMHAGFFLGPRAFYAALRDMPDPEKRQFLMRGIGFVNQLDGAERDLKVAQRQHARFVNTTMMVTLLGAAVSDGLADGRVVSGVGGQYNFVAMAHDLPGAHSILALRATRSKGGQVSSNILWSYGHCTIPRHLRDMVITEYGVADLRGRTDAEIIAALLNIADSRFQNALLAEAKAAGKIAANYRIADMHRHNTPQALEERFGLARARGLFSEFPFGTDFTQEEITLGKALKRMQAKTTTRLGTARAITAALVKGKAPAAVQPYLARMELERAQSTREWLWQRLLANELRDLLAAD